MVNTKYVCLGETTWGKLLHFSTSKIRHWGIQEIMQCCLIEKYKNIHLGEAALGNL
jgi:hypothetical protein